MTTHVVVLGAGFGGLEVSRRLSEHAASDDLHVTLIDKAPGFTFGFSKFDLVFGDKSPADIRAGYEHIDMPGVDFRRETITSIDPSARRVVTDGGSYNADVLVVALGAEYDFSAPLGFKEGGFEFYSIDGALRLRDRLQTFESGHAIIAVLGEPFKCPPAPCEGAMLLDEWLEERGRRANVQITVVSPWGRPIPPSPDGSKAILDRFAERNMTFAAGQLVTSIDPSAQLAHLRDGGTMPYDLFIGVPVHRVPAVVEASGLAVDGWVPVDRGTLETSFPDVYAVGDVTSVGVPKAGVFAEGAGAVVAERILAKLHGEPLPPPYGGVASCYVEFGDHRVGRVDADFSGPQPVGPFTGPSLETMEEKRAFASDRRKRWFGL